MEFKVPYLLAMREKAPKMFRDLVKTGKMDQHLEQKTTEAYDLLDQILGQRPKDAHGEVGLADRREAEEVVRATMLDFPQTKPDLMETPEPPDDLPSPRQSIRSRAPTSSSSPATSGKNVAALKKPETT